MKAPEHLTTTGTGAGLLASGSRALAPSLHPSGGLSCNTAECGIHGTGVSISFEVGGRRCYGYGDAPGIVYPDDTNVMFDCAAALPGVLCGGGPPRARGSLPVPDLRGGGGVSSGGGGDCTAAGSGAGLWNCRGEGFRSLAAPRLLKGTPHSMGGCTHPSNAAGYLPCFTAWLFWGGI